MRDIELLIERKLSRKEKGEKEKIVKSLKKPKNLKDLSKRYNKSEKDAKSIAYGIATKISKKNKGTPKTKMAKMTDKKPASKKPRKKMKSAISEAASSVRLPTTKQEILALARDYTMKARAATSDPIMRAAYARKAAALQAQAKTMSESTLNEADDDIAQASENILTNFDTLSKSLYSKKFEGDVAKKAKEIRYALMDLMPKLREFTDEYSKNSLGDFEMDDNSTNSET